MEAQSARNGEGFSLLRQTPSRRELHLAGFLPQRQQRGDSVCVPCDNGDQGGKGADGARDLGQKSSPGRA